MIDLKMMASVHSRILMDDFDKLESYVPRNYKNMMRRDWIHACIMAAYAMELDSDEKQERFIDWNDSLNRLILEPDKLIEHDVNTGRTAGSIASIACANGCDDRFAPLLTNVDGAHVPEIGFMFKRIMSEFNERIDDNAHVDKDMLMDAFNNMMDGYPVGTAVEFALTAI